MEGKALNVLNSSVYHFGVRMRLGVGQWRGWGSWGWSGRVAPRWILAIKCLFSPKHSENTNIPLSPQLTAPLPLPASSWRDGLPAPPVQPVVFMSFTGRFWANHSRPLAGEQNKSFIARKPQVWIPALPVIHCIHMTLEMYLVIWKTRENMLVVMS